MEVLAAVQTVHACPSLPVLCVILYKTKRNPGPSESFDFERVPGFARCILEGLFCRNGPHLLETLHVQQAALLAGAKLERSSDKGLEQRVSAVGTALEFRMGLGGCKVGMVF